MLRHFAPFALIAALAACDDSQPAGGRGYFDPPTPAPVFVPPQPATIPVPEGQSRPPADFVTASRTGVETPGAPRSAIAAQSDPNAQLAQDVTAALNSTAPGARPAAPDASVLDQDIGIDPNSTSINLAAQSQEQQRVQREIAAQQRQAAQQQLVIVEPEPVPQQDINANVVQFARSTTHPVGTKRYNRPAFRSRQQSSSTCRRFASTDEAQRQFLANGGPQNDRFNLDPDGDGFACKFDPEPYRALKF